MLGRDTIAVGNKMKPSQGVTSTILPGVLDGLEGMGPDTHGRVIFMADKPVKCATAIRYLNAEIDRRVTGRIDPNPI